MNGLLWLCVIAEGHGFHAVSHSLHLLLLFLSFLSSSHQTWVWVCISQNKAIPLQLQTPCLLSLSFCFIFFASSSHIWLRWCHPGIRALAPPGIQRCLRSLQRSLPLFFFWSTPQLGHPLLRWTPEPHWWWQTQNAMVFLFLPFQLTKILVFTCFILFCCWSLLMLCFVLCVVPSWGF